MKLYFVQHGHALSKQKDPDRPLSEQGIREANNLAKYLVEACIEIPQLYHSGKTRAHQTARIIRPCLKAQTEDRLEGINPNDPVEPIADFLNAQSNDILMVGHLPFLAKMITHLVCGSATEIVQFQPGTIVCLEKIEQNWKIRWMLCPELLRQ